MITTKRGNIMYSQMATLVNPVNCAGIMGAGLALTFKSKFPKMFNEYEKECRKGNLVPGRCLPYYENGKVKVLNFPTKQHWKDSSKPEYIAEGLDWFVKNYQKLGITSIAFPALGCGRGGLSWEVVGKMMVDKLKDLPIEIELYLPDLFLGF